MEFLVGDKTLDRSFQTVSNTTRLVVNLNQLIGDKKYSIVIRGKTIKGLGEPSKDNVIIETPAMGEWKVKEQSENSFYAEYFSHLLGCSQTLSIYRISISFTEFAQLFRLAFQVRVSQFC